MVEMCKIVNSIVKVVLLLISFLSCNVLTYHVMESFLPSLINVRPVIQLRRFNSLREPKVNYIELTNMTYRIHPRTCGKCIDGVMVVVMIHSYVANFESRKVIRDTWGKSSNCIEVLFFVGSTYDNDIMKNIINESIEHIDLIQGNIEDTYKNLPFKHIMSLKWVKLFCPRVKYILKTDTDIIVRLEKLYKLLENDILGSTGLIAGHIESKEKVLRPETGIISNKIVSLMEYPETFYPPYCWGQFVLYSADAAFSILEGFKTAPYFKIEDIYVTGILARSIPGIRHINLVPNWYLSREILFNYTIENAKEDYVYGPYSLTLDEIRRYWDLIVKYEQTIRSSPNLTVSTSVLKPSVKPLSPFKHRSPQPKEIRGKEAKPSSLLPKTSPNNLTRTKPKNIRKAFHLYHIFRQKPILRSRRKYGKRRFRKSNSTKYIIKSLSTEGTTESSYSSPQSTSLIFGTIFI